MSQLLKFNHRAGYVHRHGSKTFSQDSGQVYTETIQRGGPMTSQWVWKTIGSSREAERFRSLGPGCSSLSNMAIRSAMVHILTFTIESLEGVPWSIGKKLWERITTSQLDSVHIWKVFASVYLGAPDETLKHKQHVILEPDASFKSYITPLISPSFHWITFLTLSNIHCSREDLLQLTQLINLGVLTIGKGVSCPQIGLDDSIVRAWGRAAAESGAFPSLRVLSCHSQQEITAKVLSSLNEFPSLALFAFEDCNNIGPRHKEEALKLGWRYKTGFELSRFLIQGGAVGASWASVCRASFRGSGPFSFRRVTAEGVEAIDNLPVLQFKLGDIPDAVVDVTGAQSMRIFHRFTKYVLPPNPIISSKKRPLERTSSQPSSLSGRKKPTIRSSKQQSMDSMIMGFGP